MANKESQSLCQAFFSSFFLSCDSGKDTDVVVDKFHSGNRQVVVLEKGFCCLIAEFIESCKTEAYSSRTFYYQVLGVIVLGFT